MTINSATGVISWIPTSAQVGNNTVKVGASDGFLDDTQSFTITVNPEEEKTITIRWLEDAIRYNALGDDISDGGWVNCPIPSPGGHVPSEFPATLILTDGEYHFADVAFFWNYYPLEGLEGYMVISEAGLMSGYLTYISANSGLPIRDYFEGNVEIIIGEITNWDGVDPVVTTPPEDYDGVMVGTYTQWSYAYAAVPSTLDILQSKYTGAVPAPRIGLNWWFIGHTDYITHK